MILTRTPLRCSLLGGGSDYPAHFTQHGGAVLGMAIDKYVYVGVKRVPPGQLMANPAGGDPLPIRFRVQYSKVDDCQDVSEIRHPAVRAAIKYLGMERESLEITTFADLPGRAGLGGSSAFVVGCLHALLKLKHPGRNVPSVDLAREAIVFEQHVMREAVGCQDQIFAALGGALHVQFEHGWYQSKVTSLRIAPARMAEFEASLVLAYTGTMRDAHKVAATQIAEAADRTGELDALTGLANAGREALEGREPLERLGLLLDAAWALKRRLSGVTDARIDALHARGVALGATGGKLLGAGGGGFMLFFVPPGRREALEEGLGVPTVRFRAARAGSLTLVEEP